MSAKVQYYFTTTCDVLPERLPPADSDALLREYNRRLNELVEREKKALKWAVENAIENSADLDIGVIRRAISGESS